ncbi:hypothetical protein [Chryseobacterium sediminis]|uniref:hypothetical protein n=1 Tax=Chryseobacterium sediminis TaxID=1679494 RepID=UPI0028596651|nr:hypothetical protein [Chryseobacterium sediminis]MDR6465031.1 hypothetical protein [Chryseobacterium sediminis]
MSWNFLDIFDVVLDVFGLFSSGSKSSLGSSDSKPKRKALNHNVISQKKELKDPDIPQKK